MAHPGGPIPALTYGEIAWICSPRLTQIRFNRPRPYEAPFSGFCRSHCGVTTRRQQSASAPYNPPIVPSKTRGSTARPRRAALLLLSVDPGDHRQRTQITIRSGDRPDRTERIEPLCARPLAVLALEIACRHVVESDHAANRTGCKRRPRRPRRWSGTGCADMAGRQARCRFPRRGRCSSSSCWPTSPTPPHQSPGRCRRSGRRPVRCRLRAEA